MEYQEFVRKSQLYQTAFHITLREYVALLSAKDLGENVLFAYKRINGEIGACYHTMLKDFLF
jgi:hypothetical protein